MKVPPSFTDYVSLMYHEARNIRHLVDAGHLEQKGWEKVISLPRNSEAAWAEVEHFAASAGSSTNEVVENFEVRFGRSLEDLVKMFENGNWRHARLCGGNAWGRIGRKVLKLKDALMSGDVDAVSCLGDQIKSESHNTGTIAEKLAKLKGADRGRRLT